MFKFKSQKNNRIYLDHASSTPIDPNVIKTLHTAFACFGNPSSLHIEGRTAEHLLGTSRKTIADSIGAHTDEIIFTSGGTESDNLAIMGVLEKFHIDHPKTKAHIIVSSVEHPAIYELAKKLDHKYPMQNLLEISYAPVDEYGVVDLSEFKKMLRPETILVSVMHANNEVGTIQPIKEIAKLIRHHKKHREEGTLYQNYPYFHSDACQSFVYEKIGVEQLGVDLLTINSSKIYGPKGAGALYARRGTKIAPMFIGGSQERDLRAGTENVPLIAGFAKAIEINEALKEKESVRLAELRDYFISELEQNFEIKLHGARTDRLPNNINVSFIGYQSEQIVIYLDAQGIAVSEKSACKADSAEVSHVLQAMYGDNNPVLNSGSVRFSLGRQTTKGDLDTVISKLKNIFKLLTKK